MEAVKEIIGKAIKDLAEDAVKYVFNKAKDYFVDREAKEQIDLQYAYEDYLKKVYDTYSKSKSIIYINEAKELKKFFVPVDLTFEKTVARSKSIIEKRYFDINNPKQKIIKSDALSDVFEQSNRIAIIGIGGQGKTMHMKYLCTNAIEQRYKIPVFVFLRWFNEHEIGEKPFEDLIYDNLQDFGFRLPKEYFLYSLECGKYVFLLDGYDEISEKIKNQISIRLQSFSQRYSNNSFIISSRPVDNIYAFDEYTVYSLSPLDIKQAAKLISRIDYAEDMKTKFIGELQKGLFEKYKSLASVPLLLTIMYLTYVDNTVLPETLVEFYDRAFETMLYGHDRRLKAGFRRDIGSGLSYSEIKEVFMAFCYSSYFNDIYAFSYASIIEYIKIAKRVIETPFDEYAFKDDLVNVACMIIRDGSEYIFLHRSFQEYFAARFVSKKMLEDQQIEFCSDFIEQIEIEMIEAGSFDELGKTRNKTIDFLSMLYQIDPKKFEHIVLKPILRKIDHTYNECQMELYKTASKYIQFFIDDEDDEIRVNFLSFLIHKKNMYCLTEKEFNVLCYFYKNVYYTSSDNTQINADNREIKQSGFWKLNYGMKITGVEVFDLIQVVSGPGANLFSSLEESILSIFEFAINRYEVLNKSHKKIAFFERVNNPKYYT